MLITSIVAIKMVGQVVESYRKIAAEVVKLLENPDTIEKVAIKGFFQGLATGSIRRGQSWPIHIILEEKGGFNNNHYQLLENIFESGMLSDGQELTEKYYRDNPKSR